MTRAAFLSFALLLALLAPAASAENGQVQATSARYDGGATQSGDLVAFFFTDRANSGLASSDLPDVNLRITTQMGEALAIEQRSLGGDIDLGDIGTFAIPSVSDPSFDDEAPPARTLLDKPLRLTEQQPGMQLHILPPNLGNVVAYTARGQSGLFEPLESVAMTAGRFGEPQPLDEDIRAPESPEFWPVLVQTPVVAHEDDSPSMHIRFVGDFVVELKGATLEAVGARGVTLESGVWREALYPGVPSEVAYKQRDVLVRLFLSNATLDLDIAGGTPEILWAAPEVVSTHDGEVILQGANGQVEADGGPRLLRGETYAIPKGSVLGLSSESGALALAVGEAEPQSTSHSPLVAKVPATYVGIVAVAALVVAVGLGALRRWGTATLHHMEVALEGGRFARAARLAKRILLAQPDSQSAMLGRAIALSRDGRTGAAIQELHVHLESRGASDGSLHYVLGASYLDVGRLREARAALGEAVRRTPALQRDADQLLGQAPPVRRNEVNGYV